MFLYYDSLFKIKSKILYNIYHKTRGLEIKVIVKCCNILLPRYITFLIKRIPDTRCRVGFGRDRITIKYTHDEYCL